jgi:hypothetical protein
MIVFTERKSNEPLAFHRIDRLLITVIGLPESGHLIPPAKKESFGYRAMPDNQFADMQTGRHQVFTANR